LRGEEKTTRVYSLQNSSPKMRFQQSISGGHGGEVAEKIWFHSGRLSVLPTFARAMLSIVTVAMGASLG